MALFKNKKIKGVEVGYWKIIDCNVKTGLVALGLFASQADGQNRENMFDRVVFTFNFNEVSNPLQFAYNKIKESNIVDGQEENWFANAEDC